MADDSDRATASAAPAKAPPAAPAQTVEASEFPSERELNSPDVKTLILLGVVFVVSVCSWGAARFACNMHPPESRGAPKLATEKLITTAKDAAIEFVQRWRSNDFDGALEVTTGQAREEMERGKAECQQNANDCARKREAEAGRLTTAVVLRQDGFVAESRVTTQLRDKKDVYRVMLQRDGLVWKAASQAAE